ncbi:MAG: hypothetical protein R3330_15965, partial [Saprospiraceae bacterium]|nr:hypothetical protein [Saprospiraceae bacterium]
MQLKNLYSVTPQQIDFFQDNRYIKIKQVFDAETITHFNGVISSKVAEINTEHRDLAARNTYGKAFLQLMNLWEEDDEIRSLVFSRRQASIATQQIQADGGRLDP